MSTDKKYSVGLIFIYLFAFFKGTSGDCGVWYNKLCNDGGLSDWSPYSPCPVSCGEGIQLRFRTCTNPPPGPGGKGCVGTLTETKRCDLGICQAYKDLGCWTDKLARAVNPSLELSTPILDGLYWIRAGAIQKCYEAAKQRGFTIFTVQNGGQCFANNGESYKMYGSSSQCKQDGTGGFFANQVYGVSEKLQYTHAGCWKDTLIRAVNTLEGSTSILDAVLSAFRADAIQKCYLAAKERKFEYFAVQNGGWCAAGNGGSYKKYGDSTFCLNGKGGIFANDVYTIRYD